MIECTGCSKSWKRLDPHNPICSECANRADGKINNFPACIECSRQFRFLAPGMVCDRCIHQRKEEDLTAVGFAIENPPNPRGNVPTNAHFPVPAPPVQAQPYSAPQVLQAGNLSPSKPSPLSAQSQRIIDQLGHDGILHNRHVAAHLNAPIHRGALQTTSRANVLRTTHIHNIMVVVSKIALPDGYDSGIPSFPLNPFPNDTPCADILVAVVNFVDRSIINQSYFQLSTRIQSIDQMTLLFADTNYAIDISHIPRTIGEYWNELLLNNQSGRIITVKNARNGVLRLAIRLKPTVELEAYNVDCFPTKRRAAKRKASGPLPTAILPSLSSNAKAARLPDGNRGILVSTKQYCTVLPEIRTRLTARIYVCQMGSSKPVMLESNRGAPIEILLEEKSFAEGSMKKAFKIEIDGIDYAAKSYYSLSPSSSGPGNTAISNPENEHHIRTDVLKQTFAADIVKNFNSDIVSIPEGRPPCVETTVTETKMIIVTSTGPFSGRAFIIDPYYGSGRFVKYSGTIQAGNNVDLYGKTCDAIAHYSLHSTSGQMVLVDIQGIRVPVLVHGNYAADRLVLLDLMFHTRDCSMGLGDHGQDGINDFARQHICNDICTSLGLPSALEHIKTRTNELESTSPGPATSSHASDSLSAHAASSTALQKPSKSKCSRRTQVLSSTPPPRSTVNQQPLEARKPESEVPVVSVHHHELSVRISRLSPCPETGDIVIMAYPNDEPSTLRIEDTTICSIGPFKGHMGTITEPSTAAGADSDAEVSVVGNVKQILVIDGDLDFSAFYSRDSFFHKELQRFRELEEHFAQFSDRAGKNGVDLSDITFMYSYLAISTDDKKVWQCWDPISRPSGHSNTNSGTNSLATAPPSILHFNIEPGVLDCKLSSSRVMQVLHAFQHFAYKFHSILYDDFSYMHDNQTDSLPHSQIIYACSHTITGASCMGDLGRQGLKRFNALHCCNALCKDTGLIDPLAD